MAINAERAEVTVVGKFKDQVSSSSRKAFESFKRHATKAMNAAKVAIVAVTAALTAMSIGIAKSLDRIHKMSLRLGVSTEALSRYRLVAGLAGIDVNALTIGLQRMTRRIAEATTGTGVAVDALNELGLSAQTLNDMSPDQQFEEIAEALSKVDDQGKKVLLAFKLFDTEGVGLLQTMEKGKRGIREITQEAHNMGLTLTKEGARKVAEMNDAWTRFKMTIVGMVQQKLVLQFSEQWKGLFQTLTKMAIKFLPAVEKGLEKILNFFDDTDPVDRWQATIQKANVELEQLSFGFTKGLDMVEKQQGKLEKAKIYRKMVDRLAEVGKELDTLNDKTFKSGVIGATAAKQARDAAVEWQRELQGLVNSMEVIIGLEEDVQGPKDLTEFKVRLRKMNDEIDKSLQTQSEKLQDFIELQNIFVRFEIKTAEEASEALSRHLESIGTTVEEESDKIAEFMEAVGSRTEDAIVNFVTKSQSVLDGFRNFMLALIADIVRAIARNQIIEPLFGKTGAITEAVKGFEFSSLFGGGKAAGGFVGAGKSYLVGEKGPETFTPSTNGTISPGGGGGTYVFAPQIQTGQSQTIRAEVMAMSPQLFEMFKNMIVQ